MSSKSIPAFFQEEESVEIVGFLDGEHWEPVAIYFDEEGLLRYSYLTNTSGEPVFSRRAQ